MVLVFLVRCPWCSVSHVISERAVADEEGAFPPFPCMFLLFIVRAEDDDDNGVCAFVRDRLFSLCVGCAREGGMGDLFLGALSPVSPSCAFYVELFT